MRLSAIAENMAELAALDGRDYALRATFRRVMLTMELLNDDGIRAAAKTDRALRLLLTRRAYLRSRLLDGGGRARLLSAALDTLSRKADNRADKANGGGVISLIKDGEMIYAAFLQSYGIDLARGGKKLLWREFLWLLTCIPQGTQLFEIMRIRAEEIPADNPKYARELMRLKAIFSTDDDSYAAGAERMFGALCRAAEKEGKNG